MWGLDGDKGRGEMNAPDVDVGHIEFILVLDKLGQGWDLLAASVYRSTGICCSLR